MRCTTLLWAGIAPNGNQASSRSPISIESGDLISREIVPPARVPHIVGYQCAGKIVKMGAWVRDRKVGQRVVTIVDWGSHAEYTPAPARWGLRQYKGRLKVLIDRAVKPIGPFEVIGGGTFTIPPSVGSPAVT
jgi:hypothetical protein